MDRFVYVHPWVDPVQTAQAFSNEGIEAKVHGRDVLLVTLPDTYPQDYNFGRYIRSSLFDISTQVKFVCDPQPQCERYAIPKQRNDL